MSKCIECGAPARLLRDVEGFSEHCSNACAIATWNRCVRLGTVVCVGAFTTKQIDTALSTTGWEEP